MNTVEAFEFLNIAATSDKALIKKAYGEKYNYFSLLLNTAPTSVLKEIHKTNLEKLAQIKELLIPETGYSTDGVAQMHEASMNGSRPHVEPSPKAAVNNWNDQNSAVVGWLVVHTEGQPPSSFEMRPGLNFIGREVSQYGNAISVVEDMYVSRLHAVVEARALGRTYEFIISDGLKNAGGKSSKNGTFINGNSLRLSSYEQKVLRDGDTIQVGYTKLVLKVKDKDQSTGEVIEEVGKTQYLKTVVFDIS